MVAAKQNAGGEGELSRRYDHTWIFCNPKRFASRNAPASIARSAGNRS